MSVIALQSVFCASTFDLPDLGLNSLIYVWSIWKNSLLVLFALRRPCTIKMHTSSASHFDIPSEWCRRPRLCFPKTEEEMGDIQSSHNFHVDVHTNALFSSSPLAFTVFVFLVEQMMSWSLSATQHIVFKSILLIYLPECSPEVFYPNSVFLSVPEATQPCVMAVGALALCQASGHWRGDA